MPNCPKISMSPFRGMPTDRIVTVGDVMPESEWRASSYYHDWCKSLQVFHVMAADIVTKGRHDPCVGIRGAPVVEAMMALVLADHKLLHRAQNG